MLHLDSSFIKVFITSLSLKFCVISFSPKSADAGVKYVKSTQDDDISFLIHILMSGDFFKDFCIL